jgi:hypothetical protein
VSFQLENVSRLTLVKEMVLTPVRGKRRPLELELVTSYHFLASVFPHSVFLMEQTI